MEHGTCAILATLFSTKATPLKSQMGTGFQFTPTKRIEHEYILASILEQVLKACPPQLQT